MSHRTGAARAEPEVRNLSGTGRPQPDAAPGLDNPIGEIVASFDQLIIRVYSRLRFAILRQVFLEEIGRHLPRSGRVLDLGCGFGLFSLYFAALEPKRSLLGLDRDRSRIAYARTSARRLGLDNAEYLTADALEWDTREEFHAIYLLDLIHHLPRAAVPAFLRKLRDHLRPGGVLVVKDVEDRPRWKAWFTLLLDRLMVGWGPIHYWPASELIPLFEELGFRVAKHGMPDFLPYPHVLYVCRLPST